MQDRGFIFHVHRLGWILLRASRYGGQGPRPTVGCVRRAGGSRTSDLRPPTSWVMGAARVGIRTHKSVLSFWGSTGSVWGVQSIQPWRVP